MEIKNKYTHSKENGTSTLIIKQYNGNNLIGTYEYIIPIEYTQQVSKYQWNVPTGKITPCITLNEHEQLKQRGIKQFISLNNICPFVRICNDNAEYKYYVSGKNSKRYNINDEHLYRTNNNEYAINNFIQNIDRILEDESQQTFETEYFSINFDGKGRKFINVYDKTIADSVKLLTGVKFYTLKINDERVYGFAFSEKLLDMINGIIQLREEFSN